MHPFFVLVIGLGLIGLLSPLLTFAKLFQLKEWRLDRLREHLRKEGWMRQLFGTARLFLLCIVLPFSVVRMPLSIMALTTGLFALLSLAQLVTRRQPKPVWTAKALMIVAIAFGLSFTALLVSSMSGLSPVLFPLIIVGQPLFVLMAWALLLPLDAILKKRVMDRAAAIRRKHPEATVIGIAGSVGKTTTKELLKHLLQDLSPLSTPAHVNTEMGVAAWITRELSKVHTSKPLMIVEMGAYREGEIALLSHIAKPTIGVLTTLGEDHLALFGSTDAIRRANSELLHALPAEGSAFLAFTDEHTTELATQCACPATTVGMTQSADLHPSKAEEREAGIHLTVDGRAVDVPLRGLHNVSNILLAVAVARHLGIAWARIVELLATFRPLSHTFSVTQERDVTVLDDTYNISVPSFASALAWAQKKPQRPRVLLTAGLLEVGDEEDAYHAQLGELANGCIERAIFLSPAARSAFASTFHGETELLTVSTQTVPPGALLLCVGRMPLSTIQRLLPQ